MSWRRNNPTRRTPLHARGATTTSSVAATLEADDGRFVAIDSCHSTWLFDSEQRRFCRVLKSLQQDPTSHPASVSTQWRDYDRLVLSDDSDAFVVFLDASGTRLLRSWRHGPNCEQCGLDVTGEMSLDELRRLTRA